MYRDDRRSQNENRIELLKSYREVLVGEAIEWYHNQNAVEEHARDDSGRFGSKVACYFDKNRKQIVAKVMIYPKGRDSTNFCIIFDENRTKLDWTWSRESWLPDF